MAYNINTAEGVRELVQAELSKLLERKPILGQSNVGDSTNPVALINGILEKCGDVGVKEKSIYTSAGYIQYDNGLIIQWGRSTLTANAWTVITMPITFSSGGNILATPLSYSSTENSLIVYGYEDGSGSGHIGTAAEIYATSASDCCWLAIGH